LEKVTANRWVINTIQECKIEFWALPRHLNPPAPLFPPRKGNSTHEHRDSQAPREGSNLSGIHPPDQRFFVQNISRKDGSQRPVINLRNKLNHYVILGHFKMESIHLVENLIQDGDWMIKVDLKDAYFFHPSPSGRSPVASFSMAGPNVPISMPAIRTVLSSMHIHKSNTPNSGMVETTGDKNDYL